MRMLQFAADPDHIELLLSQESIQNMHACAMSENVLICHKLSGLDAGDSDNAAYLANVCVAPSARRQGVGGTLIDTARQHARAWGKAHGIHCCLGMLTASYYFETAAMFCCHSVADNGSM